MSDYKLEPKSIVDELAQFIRQVDGNNKMGAGSLADKICERFHVHSPDVQGEPLAWVTADTVDGQSVNGKPRRIWWENNEGVGMPIYAAPQPAEQQPAPDVARLVEALDLARRTLAMAAIEGEVTRRIDSALAAYRQGGEA